MMKKFVVMAAIGMMLTGALFAEGKKDEAAATKGGPVKLVFSSVSVPEDAHTKAMTVFKNEVEKLSGGQITVDVYDSGQLFTQQAEQDAVRQGKVDIVYAGDAWLAPTVPYLGMFGAAFTFQSYEQMTEVFNGPIGKKSSRMSQRNRESALSRRSIWAQGNSISPRRLVLSRSPSR